MNTLKWQKGDWLKLFIILLLALMYLSPGAGLMLTNAKDKVLSDGSDPATLPYSYDVVIEHAKNNPMYLFFGAVPTERLNPPEGFSIWVTWFERFVVALFHPFVTVEQLSTLLLYFQFVVGGLAFYLLSLSLGWNRAIGFALALCWAFNAYTRARSKVHPALAGTFIVPMIFLGLQLAVSRTSRRSLFFAGLALLFSATAAHYYLFIAMFMLPLFIAFVVLAPQWKSAWKKISLRVVVAAVPAVMFVGWSYFKPIPSEWAKKDTITHLKTGDAEPGQHHPFMTRFAAHFVDYFTGEIAIGLSDLNPLRGWISQQVVANIGDGNTHERSNGIRWLLWAAFFAALFVLSKPDLKNRMDDETKKRIWLFIVFAAFSMWLSFSPKALGLPTGPSAWLAALVSQYRVPSRAGVFVHFGVLMVVGYFLQAWLYGAASEAKGEGKKKKATQVLPLWPKARKILLMSGILPILAIVELPPFLNSMPIAPVMPLRTDLADGQPCGYGLYYPYVSGTWGLLEYYNFLQSMRGSRCKIINSVTDTVSPRNRQFMQKMPLHPKYLEFIKANPQQAKAQLVQFAQCMPVDWLVFDRSVVGPWSDDVCATLGFQKTSADTCVSPQRDRVPARTSESCLN